MAVFSADTTISVGDRFVLTSPPPRIKRRSFSLLYLTVLSSAIFLIPTIILSIKAPALTSTHIQGIGRKRPALISKIAFGSGSSKSGASNDSQVVWTRAIIPSDPHAWIWVGDMVNLDEPTVNCTENPKNSQCWCRFDRLTHSSCVTGNVSHAKARAQSQVADSHYQQFLEFMCPRHGKKEFMPASTDTHSCQRPVLGTYDDRDYGWKHGDSRFPAKDAMKNVFLDSIGEPSSSGRRAPGHGIEAKHVLNTAWPGKQIDVLLLDERYNRDPLPCYARREFCKNYVLKDLDHHFFTWCQDFLRGNGSRGSRGSCCRKDQSLFFGWCQNDTNRNHSLWGEACDPRHAYFGVKPLVVKLGEIQEEEALNPADTPVSPYCEVLGRKQREWLESALLSSTSPIKLLVSPSPLFGNPTLTKCWRKEESNEDIPCQCSGDDWECFRPAQLHLMDLIAKSPGCVVVLSGGGSGFSDIKVVRPGTQTYDAHYQTESLLKPIYQVTAGGLVKDESADYSCLEGSRVRDQLGTREYLECDFIPTPSFGFVEVDWSLKDPTVQIQVRDGRDGLPKIQVRFSLSQCSGSTNQTR